MTDEDQILNRAPGGKTIDEFAIVDLLGFSESSEVVHFARRFNRVERKEDRIRIIEMLEILARQQRSASID